MKLICRDLPRHGLVLVDLSEPFSERIIPSFISKWQTISDSVQLRSLALLNESDQTVVAYKLLWNLDYANGTCLVDEKSFANIEVLMGVEPTKEQVNSFDDPTIKPGGFRLFSLSTRMPIAIRSEAKRSSGIGALTGGMTVLRDDSEGADYVRAVSIDGAFYGDGRFVGPDTTGYFAMVRAEIRAKLDLLHEISRAVETGGSLSAVFDNLRANTNSLQYRPRMTASEAYDFYRQIFAEEILRMRGASGEANAARLILQELSREWPELRKV